MDDNITFNGKKYVSAVSAASLSGFTRDHIGKLCRTKKIIGKRIGKTWYVEENSLHSFLVIHQYERSRRRQTLAEVRKADYERIQMPLRKASALQEKSRENHSSDSVLPLTQKSPDISEQFSRMMSVPAGVSNAALSAAHIPVYHVTPVLELAHKLLAITLAVLLTLGIYTLLEPQSAHALFAGVQTGMHGDMHAIANLYDTASRLDLEENAAGIAQNGNGEFAAAAASQSSIVTALRSFLKL